MTLSLVGATVRYPAATTAAVSGMSLSFEIGTHTAILGSNGAGKSTVLRALAGLLPCESGEARLDQRSVASWPRREFARRVAFVSSAEESGFPQRTEDYVSLGRNPYLGPWSPPSPTDRAAVNVALERADMTDLRRRYLGTLSAGELQRARIARALAQEPEILLLDEPTAHLDIGHEFAAFALLSELTATLGLTTISITHNLNMASRFCGRIVLLRRGVVVADGSPSEILTPQNLSEAFEWPVETVSAPNLGLVAVPVPRVR